jgi:cytochrome c553
MNGLNRYILFFIFLIAVLHLVSCTPDLPKDVAAAYEQLPEKMDYNLHVKPLLSDKCFSCHGPDKAKQKAGLRLDIQSFAYAELPESPGKVAIDPGNLNGSELFHRIISENPEYKMPSQKSHLVLSAKEKAILIKWIKQGAEYKAHWAFVKPEKEAIPEIPFKNWAINPIDNFIGHTLALEKLQPSKQATKELLLRRVSLDLTGLPPTIEEMDFFLNDNSPKAYEKQVDRLLQSPHYGEKMAIDWLDLARFADSHGYTVDRIRDMSPYRDWVIGAFNKNMPFNQFIQWQLAGDLMPNPNKEMLIATAFNRVHQQNMEGGIIDEEFQTEYVIDRTNTAGIAIMGLPIGCARCHDHKYDPISQKNYYEMFSFFNKVKEAGQISWDDAMPSPTILLPSPEKENMLRFIQSDVVKQEKKLIETKNNSTVGFQNWMQSKKYKELQKELIPQNGLQAQYDFNNGSLKNLVKAKKSELINKELKSSTADKAVFENRDNGKALSLNGDQWFDANYSGVFSKSDPFSISISLFVPNDFKEGVIFHKCISERLYNYRGYHLYLKDNLFTVNLSHAAPSNAIAKITQQPVIRNQWVQLTMTYDGSSTASGLKLFQNGFELALETTMDQLTKDILMHSKNQPGLQIGAWDRGYGFKGGKVDDLLVYNRNLTDFEIKIIAGQANWSSITNKPTDQLSDNEINALKNYYSSAIDAGVLDEQKKLQEIRRTQSDSTEYIKEVMVMQDAPKPRKTFVLVRGNYDNFGEEVFPNTPPSILPFAKNLPKNRYGLALWLTDANHPLTARVAVNRYWQNFFVNGLVKTSEDFGNQGELPSHPALLDWLAVTFRESGWDTKKLCKLIVLSATYQQDSKAVESIQLKDPENRLLSHGPSVRMTAEMIRDNALKASGLLNNKIGGKSVKPYQPDGLWEINNTSYKSDSGDAVYRRSLYVLVKRSVPNPTLSTFDATSRSYCVARRQRTNTPLQALVTLNDPTFVEAEKIMGEQIATATDYKKGITDIYRKLTGLTPNKSELELLEKIQSSELKKMRVDTKKTKGWLNAGQYIVNKNIEPALIAANAVVASVILNSDATLTKR